MSSSDDDLASRASSHRYLTSSDARSHHHQHRQPETSWMEQQIAQAQHGEYVTATTSTASLSNPQTVVDIHRRRTVTPPSTGLPFRKTTSPRCEMLTGNYTMSRKRSMRQRLTDIEQWDLSRKMTPIPIKKKSKKSVSSARIDLLAGSNPMASTSFFLLKNHQILAPYNSGVSLLPISTPKQV
uniref:Uncharacterized protein n=1 Tax=Panagrellus redivivus TaxID=6233 RepID=A0A7E4VEB0_PANRE